MRGWRGDFEIGRVLHLKSEIRNIRLDCLSGELPLKTGRDDPADRAVGSPIKDFRI